MMNSNTDNKNELELLMMGDTAARTAASSASSTCSDLTMEDDSGHNSSASSRPKVLQLPQEWIHGHLPTDKEYGRWIKAQMSANEYDGEDDDEMTIGCWNSMSDTRRSWQSKSDNDSSDNDSNPFKSIHKVIVDTFSKQHSPAFLHNDGNLRFREKTQRQGTTLELACLST